jgi:hypothetical protein
VTDRDEYWRLVSRKAAELDRVASWILAGELADAGLTTVDILRYTDGLPDVNIAVSKPRLPSQLPDVLTAVAESALARDLESVKRIGHIPSGAVNEAPRLTEDEYWDACRSIVKYTARYTDVDDRFEQSYSRVLTHPFLSSQQYRADVLGWTHHLQTMPMRIWTILAQQWGTNAPDAVQLSADGCMAADVWRLASSQYGLGYIPNISKLAYTDEVKKLAQRMNQMQNPTVFAAIRIASTFIGDFYDAIDVLRMSREPEALDAWFAHGGRVFDKGYEAIWPDGKTEPYDVPQMVILAARVAASSDARAWLDFREAPPGERRPVLTVDQYQDDVRQQVRQILRAPLPAFTIFQMVMTHPLIRAPRMRQFPYNALDILRNTAHPNALFDSVQRQRREFMNEPAGKAPVPAGDIREDFLVYRFEEDARSSVAGFPTALGHMAAAAFLADILDDLGTAALGKYRPNEVR